MGGGRLTQGQARATAFLGHCLMSRDDDGFLELYGVTRQSVLEEWDQAARLVAAVKGGNPPAGWAEAVDRFNRHILELAMRMHPRVG